jgi:hypothetical protein
MKKVITQKVLEEVQYFCDAHPERECFSELKTASWYGSHFDLLSTEVHLCDECMTELYKNLKEKYNVEPKDIDLI